LHRGITATRLGGMALAALLLWATLSSQLVHLGPVLRMQASMRPIAERLRQEPGWERAQIIVAHTRAHGLKFYLGRLTDATLDKSDVVLEPTPAIEARLHPSIEELRIRDSDGTATYLVTRERELERLDMNEWTVLMRKGSFVLLERTGDGTRNGPGEF
jgi:hypothetical protein